MLEYRFGVLLVNILLIHKHNVIITAGIWNMAVKLCFKTDFSRLLKEENKINHTVKVITKTEVIECSGAVLCQHSDILQQLVAKDNELFLDNYTYVQECILVLYGAEVVLNIDNILDLMKFSVQFDINEIYLQCLDWIEKNFSEDNVLAIFKICNSVSKFAKLCGTELPNDVFVHVATYLKMVNPTAVMELFKNECENSQTDFLRFFFGTKGLICCFEDSLCDIVLESNITTVFPVLCDNFDELKKLTKQNFRNLIMKIDSTHVADLVPKEYIVFKEKLLKLLMEDQSPFSVPHYLFEGIMCLTDNILKDKLWKNLNENQIIETQKLFNTPSKHFLYSEIMIAWVSLKKPSQEIVAELTQTLKLYKLGSDYISMLNDKYKALGYTDLIPATLLTAWKRPNHYISDTRYVNQAYGSGFIMQFKISCRGACNPSGLYYVGFQSGREKLDWGWLEYIKNTGTWCIKTSPTTLSDDFLRCPHETTQSEVKKEKLVFYGATKDDVHLEFHTDGSDVAHWRHTGGSIIRAGCIQFDGTSN